MELNIHEWENLTKKLKYFALFFDPHKLYINMHTPWSYFNNCFISTTLIPLANIYRINIGIEDNKRLDDKC